MVLGHQEYLYREKDWLCFDSYTGHTFPPGKEIVFYKKKPFWIMSYVNNKKTPVKANFVVSKFRLGCCQPLAKLSYLVGRVGFEPTKAKASRFTVCPS